jgi:hypothetical protein
MPLGEKVPLPPRWRVSPSAGDDGERSRTAFDMSTLDGSM